MYLKDNISILETKKTLKPGTNILVSIIILEIIYLFTAIFAGFIAGLIFALNYGQALFDPEILASLEEEFSLVSLFSLIIPILFVYLYSRFVNKRNNKSLGLVGQGSVRDYILGILLGLASIAIISIVLALLGQVSINFNPESLPIGLFILYIIAWMIQGFAEEFLCRSIFMNLIAAKRPIFFAIIANSLIFSLMHIANANFSILAAINIFLLGVLFSLIFYLTDNIWLAAAFHSFWNMTQANIFGAPVSGSYVSKATIFYMENLPGYNSLLTGGDFGLEGGLICTLLVLIGIAITIKIIKDKGLMEEEEIDRKVLVEE